MNPREARRTQKKIEKNFDRIKTDKFKNKSILKGGNQDQNLALWFKSLTKKKDLGFIRFYQTYILSKILNCFSVFPWTKKDL